MTKAIETDDESLMKVAAFLQGCFPKTDKFTFEFVKWQYTQNPLGPMQGMNIWDGDKLISHFAGLPIEMNLFGTVRKGVTCINVATDSAYRGKKLFAGLGQRVIEQAKERGYDFMLGVPNANSTHVFLKYFEFYLISPLTAKVGFGKNIYPEKRFNCYKTWDEKQWQWRLSNPENKYQVDKTGHIYSPVSFFAKTISNAGENIGKYTIASRSIGIRPVNLYIGTGADLSKGLYFNIPSFIKRPPFNLAFKDLTGGQIPHIRKEDVFFQSIDMDII